MTDIINGKNIAEQLHTQLKQRLATMDVRPMLVAILIGDNPASTIYVRRKKTAAESLGMKASTIEMPSDTSEYQLLDLIGSLNHDPGVHGILVQLPLPPHIDTGRIVEAIAPIKDVDGFHPFNAGRLISGTSFHIPCTPKGILALLAASDVSLAGKRALMIGCSQIVGYPTATLLTRAGATVMIAHRLTENLPAECLWAEIIIVAAGCPNLVRGAFLHQDAIVIDVGINRVDGKIVGDVAFDECLGIAKAITPVPGGVGPMTVACLLENTIQAAQLQHRTTYCDV